MLESLDPAAAYQNGVDLRARADAAWSKPARDFLMMGSTSKVRTFPVPAAPRKALETTTAAALALREFDPVNYVVECYVAEGLTILAGRPKTGKSWLALAIALAVAAGGEVLGKKVEAGDVLYLGLEDNLRRLKGRLAQLLPYGEHPPRLHLATSCPRLGDGCIEAVEAWCGSVERPRLIVVDVFGKVRPEQRGKDINPYDADYRAIEPMKRLADTRGIAVMLVHHTNKREEPFDPFDAVSGTTGLTGAADTVLVLARDTQGTTLYGRGRDIEEIETALSFDPTRGLWTALGNANEVHRSDERSKLLAALRSSAAPLGPRDLAGITGMRDGNVRRLLGKMVAAGEIEKAGYGSYRASPGNTGHTGNGGDGADG